MNGMKGNEWNEYEKGMRDNDNGIMRMQVDQAMKQQVGKAVAI